MSRIGSVLAGTAAALAISACGGDDPVVSVERPPAAPPAAGATAEPEDAAPAGTGDGSTRRARGTRITLRDSEFGTMLFDSRRQAIYVFENDRDDVSRCHGACAEAWPPVYTRARPRAGAGVRARLLGTIRRRDGRRQVTYAGRPLYFYANEGPGQVLCHNVDLNGGLWWVVGPDGRPRP